MTFKNKEEKIKFYTKHANNASKKFNSRKGQEMFQKCISSVNDISKKLNANRIVPEEKLHEVVTL